MNDENIGDLAKTIFLENGFDCDVKVVEQPKGLPLYMVKNRGFLEACVEGVPFIAPSQIYTPFLGIAMQNTKRAANKRNTGKKNTPRKLTPQGQLLLLYMLYKVKDSYVTKMKAAQDTGLNPMAVSRCSRELEKLGLVRLQENGRSVLMTCACSGKELVEKAIPYLINPVKKRIVVTRDNLKGIYPRAGETALSARTLLAPPRIEAYACQKKDLPPAVTDKAADLRWLDKLELIEIQIWGYNPSLFAADGSVDPLSLYMSLKDAPDERIHGSLDQMMENVKW